MGCPGATRGEDGPRRTLDNRGTRWSEPGAFARILAGLAAEEPEEKAATIDATCLETHRGATSLRVENGGADA